MIQRPFSQACENNKAAILAVIEPLFANAKHVLEVGSGTGQHAAFFSQKMPHLYWQPTDCKENIEGLLAARAYSPAENMLKPLILDVDNVWPIQEAENVFSANTVHIMSWSQVENFFSKIGIVLGVGGYFCLYGPFNYKGCYTSESNASFDQWLKNRDPSSGIRNFESIDALAQKSSLVLCKDVAMPANNRCLVWKKQ